MCCSITFWLFENLQAWSWGYNWGRAPTSYLLRLVGCTRKHISNIRWCLFQIMFIVHVVIFPISSGCTKMFPHWLSWWSTLSGTLPTGSGIQRWQVFTKFYNLAANSTGLNHFWYQIKVWSCAMKESERSWQSEITTLVREQNKLLTQLLIKMK